MDVTVVGFRAFSKKINSTKQPEDEFATYTCTLKEQTSFKNPTFKIKNFDFLYTSYLKWEEMNAYYYIEDCISITNDVFEVQCKIDALATCKAWIEAYTGYVEYAAAEHNKWIPDPRATVSHDLLVNSNRANVFHDNHGTLIITVAGHNSFAQSGLVEMFSASDAQVSALLGQLYDRTFFEQVGDRFGGDISKALISAHWVPWDVSGGSSEIYVGDEGTGVMAGALGGIGNALVLPKIINIPWNYTDFRDMPPYSSMELSLPGYGVVSIDQSKLKGQTQMIVYTAYGFRSGVISYVAVCGDWVGVYNATVGVNLATGQTATPSVTQSISGVIGGAVAGGVGIASMIASGGVTIPAVAGVLGGITAIGTGVTNAFMEESHGSGSNGGDGIASILTSSDVSSKAKDIILTLRSKVLSMHPSGFNTIEGRPLFATRKLGDLSGYIKCSGASIPCRQFASVQEEVNKYVNQGFYLE